VVQTTNDIFISQQKYAQKVLERFNMDQCNSVHNPVVLGFKLTRDKEWVRVDNTLYKQMIGSLMFLIATRPDLMFIVSLISKYMEHPTESYLLVAKRILRYVKDTIGFEVFYKKEGDEELIDYTNNDHAGDQDDTKSTLGYVFIMNSGVVSWPTKK